MATSCSGRRYEFAHAQTMDDARQLFRFCKVACYVQLVIVYSGLPQFRTPTASLGLAGNEVSIFMKRALAPGRRRRIRPRLEEHAKLVSQTM